MKIVRTLNILRFHTVANGAGKIFYSSSMTLLDGVEQVYIKRSLFGDQADLECKRVASEISEAQV